MRRWWRRDERGRQGLLPGDDMKPRHKPYKIPSLPCKTCGKPTTAWRECQACMYARRKKAAGK